MAMTKKEKAEVLALRNRLTDAEAKAQQVEDLTRALVELLRDEIESVAREVADEMVDDLQISR